MTDWRSTASKILDLHQPDITTPRLPRRGVYIKTQATSLAIYQEKYLAFLDISWITEARIRETKCHISPIPNRGLEIPVTLVVKKGTPSGEVFSQMKDFLEEYYIEPELFVKKKASDSETGDNEYIPVEDTTNMAVSEELEQEQKIEKEEEKKKESDIVVIDG